MAIRVQRGQRIAIGVIFSVACVAVLARLVDWRQLLSSLASMNVSWLALAAPLLVACYVVFAFRWWFLLRCDPHLPPRRLFAVLMMGFAVNVILPLRGGDALRAYLVGRSYGAGMSRAIATIVLERLLDIAAMLLLASLITMQIKIPESIHRALLVIGLVIGTIVAVIVILGLFIKPIVSFLSRARSEVGRFWPRVLAAPSAAFAQALTMEGSRTQLVLAITFSIFGWAAFCGSMIICTAALHVSSPALGGLLLVVLTNLGGMIPSSPGSIGVYHALAVLALSITGTSAEAALAVAIVSHALIVSTQLLLGMGAFCNIEEGIRSSLKVR